MKGLEALRALKAKQEAEAKEMVARHRAEPQAVLPELARGMWERSQSLLPVPAKSTLSEKAAAVRAAILAGTTVSPAIKEAALKVMGAALDEDLGGLDAGSRRFTRDDAFRPGTFLVPLNDPNGHSYALGRAALVVQTADDGDAIAVDHEGETGAWLPPHNDPRFEWRPATGEEVLAAVSGWPMAVTLAAAEPVPDRCGNWENVYQAAGEAGEDDEEDEDDSDDDSDDDEEDEE